MTLQTLAAQLEALIGRERDPLPNLANASALIFHSLEGLNWAGFYLYKGGELVLGPFQGKPACVRIALERGVCGAAARQRRTLVVDDVHAFAGHIACDAASKSELVVPLIHDGRLLGVLDVDSPMLARFSQTDVQALQELCRVLVLSCDWPVALSSTGRG